MIDYIKAGTAIKIRQDELLWTLFFLRNFHQASTTDIIDIIISSGYYHRIGTPPDPLFTLQNKAPCHEVRLTVRTGVSGVENKLLAYIVSEPNKVPNGRLVSVEVRGTTFPLQSWRK